MKTNNQKITPGATHTYFYDGWLLVKETRHPAASQLGSDAAGSRVSMGETASQCLMRVVEEREASAAAVAEAFCKPSEFHYAVCPLLARSHIAISVVGCFASNLQFFGSSEFLVEEHE